MQSPCDFHFKHFGLLDVHPISSHQALSRMSLNIGIFSDSLGRNNILPFEVNQILFCKLRNKANSKEVKKILSA